MLKDIFGNTSLFDVFSETEVDGGCCHLRQFGLCHQQPFLDCHQRYFVPLPSSDEVLIEDSNTSTADRTEDFATHLLFSKMPLDFSLFISSSSFQKESQKSAIYFRSFFHESLRSTFVKWYGTRPRPRGYGVRWGTSEVVAIWNEVSDTFRTILPWKFVAFFRGEHFSHKQTRRVRFFRCVESFQCMSWVFSWSHSPTPLKEKDPHSTPKERSLLVVFVDCHHD